MKKKVPDLRFREFSGEWQEKKLGDIAKVYDGTHQTPNYTETGIPFYSVEHVTANNFRNTKFVSLEVYESEKKRVTVERGDILMTRIGDIGTAKYISWNAKASFYVSLALIKQSEVYDSIFLCQYIKTDKFQNELWKRTIHVAFPKKINLGEISNCGVELPTKEEQKKIAEFLGVVDDKIFVLQKKKELLQKYKKGVMQAIFSQKVRFKDEDGEYYPNWQEIKLGDILFESHEKTTLSGQFDILSSTSKGLFKQVEYFNKEIASKDNTGYKILRKDQLVFSPQNLWLGNINLNTKYEIGSVSPSYKIFNIKNCAVSFAGYFLTLPRMMFEYAQVSEQGASIVRRNLDLDTFMAIKINLPYLVEQQKIADFLTSIDDKISLVEKELWQATNYKKALLQQMFI